MSDEKYDDLPYVAFIGAYANVDDAKADFDAIKALHADMWIGPYDGALFTKEDGGKVKILDRDSAVTGWRRTARRPRRAPSSASSSRRRSSWRGAVGTAVRRRWRVTSSAASSARTSPRSATCSTRVPPAS